MENKDNRPKEIEEEFAEPVITSDDGKKQQESKKPEAEKKPKQAKPEKKAPAPVPKKEAKQAAAADNGKKPEGESEANGGGGKSDRSAKKIVILAAAAVVVLAIAALGIRSLVTGKGLPLVSDPLVYWNADKAVADAEELVNEINDLEGAVRILDANMDKDTDGTMKAGSYTHLDVYKRQRSHSEIILLVSLGFSSFCASICARSSINS